MPVEFDDRGLNIIGANTRALKFFDDSRNLRAEIYLDTDGQLNITSANYTAVDMQGTINAEDGYLGNLEISGVLTVDDEGGFWLGSSGSFVNPGTGVKIGFVGTSPRTMGYKDGVLRSYMSTNIFYLNADYSDSILYFGYPSASNVGHYIGAGASGLIITTNSVNLDTSADDLTIQSTNGRAIFYSAKGMIFQNYAEANPSLSAGYFFNSATYASAGDYGTVTIRAQDAAARNINVDAGPSSFAQLRIEQPTLFAGSAKTVANAYTAYIGAPPVAGTNVTLTNRYSLYADGLIYSSSSVFAALRLAAGGATPITHMVEVNAGATTSGVGLYVRRNLDAASTDSVLAYIRQQNASDDQDALLIDQAGGGYGLNVNTGLSRLAAGAEMVERTAPSAPAANGVYIYAEDNGAGKTRLMALFSSGAAQQLAIQP